MTSERIQLNDLLIDVKVYEPHLMRAPITPAELLPEDELIHAAAKSALDNLARQGITEVTITSDDIAKTQELFNQHVENTKPITAKQIQKSETALRLEAMVTEYDHQVIKHAEQIRLLVTNKLLELADHRDGRIQLKAVELLGKIADVGMFVEKQEITYKQKSYEELEQQFKEKLGLLIEGEIVGDKVVSQAEINTPMLPEGVAPLPETPTVTLDTIKYRLEAQND